MDEDAVDGADYENSSMKTERPEPADLGGGTQYLGDGQAPTMTFDDDPGSAHGGKRETEITVQDSNESEWTDTEDGSDAGDESHKSRGPIQVTSGKTRCLCILGCLQKLGRHNPTPGPCLNGGSDHESTAGNPPDEVTATIDGAAGLQDQKLSLIPARVGLGEFVATYWVLLPAGLSLLTIRSFQHTVDWSESIITFEFITHIREPLAPQLLALMTDLIPFNIDFTLQGSITTVIALIPLWIVTARGIKLLLHKVYSSLGVRGYLTLMLSILQIYAPGMIPSLLPSSIYFGHMLGIGQMIKCTPITVVFTSLSRYVFMALAFGKVYEYANKVWSTAANNTAQDRVIVADHVMLDRSIADDATTPDQLLQPGLGKLSTLPPEIRSNIWIHLFLPKTSKPSPRIYEMQESDNTNTDDRVEKRKQKVLSVIQTEEQFNSQHCNQQCNLSILRASKQLYGEIRGDLYRCRTLNFCFDNNEHGLLRQRLAVPPFEIELPSNECSRDKMNDLVKHLDEFSDLIQAWQSRKYQNNKRHCPRIGIDIRLHKGTQLYDYEWSVGLKWEVGLYHIARLLHPLKKIDKAEDVTVKAHFAVRFGQEWVPQLLHEITHQMKQTGYNSIRSIKRTVCDFPNISMGSVAILAILANQGPTACFDFINRRVPIVDLVFTYFLNDWLLWYFHQEAVDEETLYFDYSGVPPWAQMIMDAMIYWLIMDLCLSQPHCFFYNVISALWSCVTK
ncbi:MAG: hypothetical protein Q9168_006414 [Polycauliona sp. 1 TL-2023]